MTKVCDCQEDCMWEPGVTKCRDMPLSTTRLLEAHQAISDAWYKRFHERVRRHLDMVFAARRRL